MYFSLDVLVASTFPLEVPPLQAAPPNTNAALLRGNTRSLVDPMEMVFVFSPDGDDGDQYDVSNDVYLEGAMGLEPNRRHVPAEAFVEASTQKPSTDEDHEQYSENPWGGTEVQS
jgi:hypothetical protein